MGQGRACVLRRNPPHEEALCCRRVAKAASTPFRGDLAKAGLESADWALAARADFAPTEPRIPDWQVVESIRVTTQLRVMLFKMARKR